MTMITNILKLAKYFEKLAIQKTAGVTSDMAIRIMHSLIPTATQNPMDATEKQIQLTNTHLLGVAERYISRGAKIIQEEMRYSRGSSTYSPDIKKYMESSNFIDVIRLGFKCFADPKQWSIDFGGEKWKNFAEKLVMLDQFVNNFKEARDNKNENGMIKYSGLISAYMNILDGMAHNTGSFLDKMISHETGDVVDVTGGEFLKLLEDKKREAITMMDIKELKNSEDVLPFLKQHMHDNPESYLYRSMFNTLQRRNRPNEERTQEELKQIRKRKSIYLKLEKLDGVIAEINNSYNNGHFGNIDYYVQYLDITGNIFEDAQDKIKEIMKMGLSKYSMPDTEISTTALDLFLKKKNPANGKYIIWIEPDYYFKAVINGSSYHMEKSDIEHAKECDKFIPLDHDDVQNMYRLKLVLQLAQEIRQTIVATYSL